MAIWAIGDVHGCLDKLASLWEKISPCSEDEVVLLGDLIDRGPKSKGVIEFILSKMALGYRITCLRGNHEDICIRAHENRNDPAAWNLWITNGGGFTLSSFGAVAWDSFSGVKLPSDYLRFIKSFKLIHQSGEVTFVHAGLRPGVSIENQKTNDLLWIRHEFFEHPEAFDKPVIFGHNPFSEVFINGPLVGIDTGAVYGARHKGLGKLTAYDPERKIIVQTD